MYPIYFNIIFKGIETINVLPTFWMTWIYNIYNFGATNLGSRICLEHFLFCKILRFLHQQGHHLVPSAAERNKTRWIFQEYIINRSKGCNTVGNYIGHNGEQFHYDNIFASAETLIGKNIINISLLQIPQDWNFIVVIIHNIKSILCVQCLNDWLISQTNLKGTMLAKFLCHGNEKNLVSVYHILIFPNLLELALPS